MQRASVLIGFPDVSPATMAGYFSLPTVSQTIEQRTLLDPDLPNGEQDIPRQDQRDIASLSPSGNTVEEKTECPAGEPEVNTDDTGVLFDPDLLPDARPESEVKAFMASVVAIQEPKTYSEASQHTEQNGK
ncbi:hypothetical protein M569_00120 [Genlisea aurea]|uniref:Uncharacterized protein n=1 Tax=Genlisea aurea TaxID=192259 RepID=S8DAU9_9LAMI|nr:hypothetical protein M569_00120 [Genlisea aurea]